MFEALEILKYKVLLSFLNESPELCTVTELAKLWGEGKQKVSRLLMSLEDEGLIDRSNLRKPKLTEIGEKEALRYEDRFNVILNHLLYEGLDINNAEHDAYVWALFSSDEGMKVIRESEQRYHAKYMLRKETKFNGDIFCSQLQDGDYQFPFLIYREHMRNNSNISMANEGFEHPCTLSVHKHVGKIYVKPTSILAYSRFNGKELNGMVRNLRYLENGKFKNATENGEYLCFPASAVSFLNIGMGVGQILHGSVCIKMQCSVGTMHMPESTAIFTIMI